MAKVSTPSSNTSVSEEGAGLQATKGSAPSVKSQRPLFGGNAPSCIKLCGFVICLSHVVLEGAAGSQERYT